MKKIIFTFITFLFTTTFLTAGSLQAYLSYAVFNTPENQPYLETYLVVNANTLKYMPDSSGSYKSVLDIQIVFSIGDSIVNFGKYKLEGPVVKDTSNIKENILDVQRYPLPEGDYSLKFTIKDPNSEQKAVSSTDEFSINFPKNEMYFSDIEFLHSYKKSESENILTKSGYELIPYAFNYFPTEVKELSFYVELYDSEQIVGDNQFLLYYYIRPFEVEKKMDQFFYMKRLMGQKITPLLNSIDIKKLPTGNYLLVVETRDRNNNLLALKETFFQRDNQNMVLNLNEMLVANLTNTFASKITSRDTLALYIDYLYPISTDIEKSFAKSIIANDDVETLQRYFLNFWVTRNSAQPEQAWFDYHQLVKQANHEFKSVRIAGYKTDRGRVYLQYGQPNAIAKSYTEPSAFPYEIWQYYDLQGQRDRKFVFYTRDIATNDFQLIHSNAVGELAFYRWQTVIYQRTNDPYNLDTFIVPDSYGSFSRDYYVQPR
jgi:GWxTD domain-containing protein